MRLLPACLVLIQTTVMGIGCYVGCGTEAVLRAQNSEPRFEVVSVKQNHSGDDRTTVRSSRKQFQFVNFPLRGILEYAFGVAGRPYLLIAVPGWADGERYDVTATVPPNAPPNTTPQMLRRLLDDRFHLKVRNEARQRDVYFLRRAATLFGPKLQPSSFDCALPVNSPLPSGLPACGLAAGGAGKLSFVRAGGATVDRFARRPVGPSGSPSVE